MNPYRVHAYIAFDGDRRIAAGDLREVARAAKQLLDRRKDTSILIFDGATSAPIELDFRGTVDDVLARLPEIPLRPRPRKMPRWPRRAVPAVRNWAWSRAKSRCCRGTGTGWRSSAAALRWRSADWSSEARRSGDDKDRIRQAQEAAYRFMSAMAGNKPHFEEAIRALFAAEAGAFRGIDRRMARRRARPCHRLAERGVSPRAPGRAPVDPAKVNR